MKGARPPLMLLHMSAVDTHPSGVSSLLWACPRLARCAHDGPIQLDVRTPDCLISEENSCLT
jgi:hypothetical protein